MFLKDRQVSSFGCFVFDIWVLRFRDLGAGCWVLGASFFGLRFRVLRFRNYRIHRSDISISLFISLRKGGENLGFS